MINRTGLTKYKIIFITKELSKFKIKNNGGFFFGFVKSENLNKSYFIEEDFFIKLECVFFFLINKNKLFFEKTL